MKKIYIVIVAGIIIISMQIYLMSSKRNEYSKAIQNLEMIKENVEDSRNKNIENNIDVEKINIVEEIEQTNSELEDKDDKAFDKNGNNIIINEKIKKICDKLITSLKLNVGDNYSDLELFYNLHFLIDILDGCYYLYDLENDKVVKANELLPCDEKVSKKGSFVRKRK